jgi:hypothetical protein
MKREKVADRDWLVVSTHRAEEVTGEGVVYEVWVWRKGESELVVVAALSDPTGWLPKRHR